MKQTANDVHPNWQRKVTVGTYEKDDQIILPKVVSNGWKKDDTPITSLWHSLHLCTCPEEWHPSTRPYCPVHNPLREEGPRPVRRANLNRIVAIRKEDV